MKREHTFSILMLLFITLLMSCSIEFDGRTSIKKVFENDKSSEKNKGKLTLVIEQDVYAIPDYYVIEIKDTDEEVVECLKIENIVDESDIERNFNLETGTYNIEVKGYLCGTELCSGQKIDYEYSGDECTLTISVAKTGEASHSKEILTEGYTETEHKWKCKTCLREGTEKHTFEKQSDGSYKCKCIYKLSAPDYKNSHHWDIVGAKNPTCVKAGHNVYWVCRNHANEYRLEKDGVTVDRKTWYQNVYIKPAGHKFSDEWIGMENGHYHVCTVCNGKSDVFKHNMTIEATLDSNAVLSGICKDCGYTMAPGTGTSWLPESTDLVEVERGEGEIVCTLSAKLDQGQKSVWSFYGYNLKIEISPLIIKTSSNFQGSFILDCWILDENGEVVKRSDTWLEVQLL